MCCQLNDDDQHSRREIGSDPIYATLSGRSERNPFPNQAADSDMFADTWISVYRLEPLDQVVSHLGSCLAYDGDGSDHASYLSVPVGTA